MKKVLLLFLPVFLLSVELEMVGTVISDNEKFITSRFMGFVKELNVTEGSRVKQGDLLYSIDTTEIDAKKTQSLMQVSMYEAQYETLKRNYERFKRLYQKGLVSKVQVEEIETNYNNLKNMVLIAKSQVIEIENQYRYLNIQAPNDGVITKKMIKVGEMAIPGMPALVLTDLSDLKITTEVSESNLNKIKINQKVEVVIPSVKFKGDGYLEAIIPNSNPMTHTFVVKVSFEATSNIYPGMYAKIFIKK